MQLMDKSLEDIFRIRKTFSIKTTAMIGFQLIGVLHFIHDKNIIHRDVKPDNCVMGSAELNENLYLIDFGLAKKYRSSRTLKQYPLTKKKRLTGTARYASIHALEGYEQSRRDDMESVGYIMAYLMRGGLPWQGLKLKSKENKYKNILEKKKEISSQELFKGFPNEFPEILDYIKKLEYTEEPEYEMLRNKLISLCKRLNYKFDYIYDWTTERDLVKRKNKKNLTSMKTQSTTTHNENRKKSKSKKKEKYVEKLVEDLLDKPKKNKDKDKNKDKNKDKENDKEEKNENEKKEEEKENNNEENKNEENKKVENNKEENHNHHHNNIDDDKNNIKIINIEKNEDNNNKSNKKENNEDNNEDKDNSIIEDNEDNEENEKEENIHKKSFKEKELIDNIKNKNDESINSEDKKDEEDEDNKSNKINEEEDKEVNKSKTDSFEKNNKDDSKENNNSNGAEIGEEYGEVQEETACCIII
jgi:serine/threonine protein kinase